MTVSNEPVLTRWQKFRMVVKVIELRLRFVALMAATAGVFAYWDTLWNYYEKWTRPPGHAVAAADSATEYYCPMHPTVIQSEPGSCPICGMPLSKRKKGEQEALPPGPAHTESHWNFWGYGTRNVQFCPNLACPFP